VSFASWEQQEAQAKGCDDDVTLLLAEITLTDPDCQPAALGHAARGVSRAA
jgi:hypothetical protein